MVYLEELLPEFKKGIKIRRKPWREGRYIKLKGLYARDEYGNCYFLELDEIAADDWEFYQEPIDWDYIIKNKCLCWFWNNDNEGIGNVGILSDVCQEMEYPFTSFYQGNKFIWKFCRPVYRNEVIFYNNKQ